jgi:Protein of unknown function (DUF664).
MITFVSNLPPQGSGMAEILRLDSDLVTCKEHLVARYLTMLADCRLLTMESIKNLRFDLLYWRRNDFDSNIGDLLYHIAYIEADWLFTDVLEGSVPADLRQQLSYDDRDNHGKLVHIGEEELESSLSRLSTVRAKLNETYAKMNMADFRRLRHSEKYDVSPEWVLHHLLQHEAEHRGQINLLKRLGTEMKGKSFGTGQR